MRPAIDKSIALILILLEAGILGSGCAVPGPETLTPLGREITIDKVKEYLTSSNCTEAYQLILPLYESDLTNNTVRNLMASTYACYAGMDFFSLLNSLILNVAAIGGAGFWSLMSSLFPSVLSPNDKRAEVALYANDALMSMIIPGKVLLPAETFNATTNNPGSVNINDRISDANVALTFTSMIAIGAIQNRYGSPNPATFIKTVNLPWNTAVTVDATGCGYASAIINMIDGLGATAEVSSSAIQPTINQIANAFSALISQACDDGCTGAAPAFGVASGCALASCTGCPAALRDHSSCTGLATNAASCAAAGIVNFINAYPVGWN